MTQVQRYSPKWPQMLTTPAGDYVAYADYDALEAKCAALEADARRYRWLHEHNGSDFAMAWPYVVCDRGPFKDNWLIGDSLDRAVDAAMLDDAEAMEEPPRAAIKDSAP